MFLQKRPHQCIINENKEFKLKRTRKRREKKINTPRHTIDCHVYPQEVYKIQVQSSSSPHSLSVPKRGRRKHEIENEDSVGPSNETTIEEYKEQYFHNIANITEEQNKNLKEQNIFLIRKIKAMQERQKKIKQIYEKAKKYKNLYQQVVIELQLVKRECQANKIALAEMKKITEAGILQIESKMGKYYLQQNQDIWKLNYQKRNKKKNT